MAPWNYPFSLVLVPLITALAAGNRAMIKPSELTPRAGEVIRKMLSAVFALEGVAVILGGADVDTTCEATCLFTAPAALLFRPSGPPARWP